MHKLQNYHCTRHARFAPEFKSTPEREIRSTIGTKTRTKAKNWLEHLIGFNQHRVEIIIRDDVLAISTKNYTTCKKPTRGDIGPVNQNDEFTMNRIAFEKFAKNNLHNPEYSNKYAVFVDGRLCDVGDTEMDLVKKIYEEFGNIYMYVGNVSQKMQTGLIESPELC